MTDDPVKRLSQPAEDVLASDELLRRVHAGETGALGVLLDRYLPWLRRLARRRVPCWARNAMDTEDLVQETVLQALKHVATFRARRDRALLRYLRRSLLNRIRDQFRLAARHPAAAALDDEQIDAGESPLQIVIDGEDRLRYQRALGRLRPPDRHAIIARLELGYDYEQLALVLAKPTAEAARVAVRRALLRLAEEMDRG